MTPAFARTSYHAMELPVYSHAVKMRKKKMVVACALGVQMMVNVLHRHKKLRKMVKQIRVINPRTSV